MIMIASFAAAALLAAVQDPWVVYAGGDGPGKGKRVVLVSGDEEYRSEEMMPQLGKILARRHGFSCTVLFAVHPATGEIDPKVNNNIPGLEALKEADLLVLFIRFRNLPPDQMKFIEDYLASGRPILGIRTATHAFDFKEGHPYARWSWRSKTPGFEGGFGRVVLGETWINHHGAHGRESTRGVPAPGREGHPILRGCEDIWGPTDVYGVRLPLPGDSAPIVLGQVLAGMKPTDKPVEGPKNNPMMPIAWTRTYTGASGKPARVFTTTMGSSQDFESEGYRRLLVNACLWAVGLEDRIPERANVDFVGTYTPSPFRFDGFKKGVTPADHRLD
ncbi:MAG TPA: ThuA domain-containing protein [Planctomycetota bacterium]|nr:ThuA domain-containing protein [Planctomycetota bacterium]